jgi:hypothetical protein
LTSAALAVDPEFVRVFRLSMLAVITLAGQTPDVFTLGPGITAPTLLHKVEPKYSPLARADHVQGTVVYETVIDVNGRATETTVISPPPDDAQKALETMRQASVLGSVQAQYFLGHTYEKGISVEADTGRARRYFRLCATRGVAQCQARLANLMLHQPGVPEYNYEQAVAWLQLAADQGLPDAVKVAAQEEAKLTPAQLKSVAQWKARLPPKQ